MGNSPWTCSVAEPPFPLVVELQCNMPETRATFDCCDAGGVVKDYLIHSVHLNNQVPILSTQAERCVAVPTTFCIGFYSELTRAGNGVLHMLCRSWCSNSNWCEIEPQVEWRNVELPITRPVSIDRYASFGQAVGKCIGMVEWGCMGDGCQAQ